MNDETEAILEAFLDDAERDIHVCARNLAAALVVARSQHSSGYLRRGLHPCSIAFFREPPYHPDPSPDDPQAP